MTAMYIPQFANSAELRHWQGVGWDRNKEKQKAIFEGMYSVIVSF